MDGTETPCADLNAAHRADNPMGYDDDVAAQDADLHRRIARLLAHGFPH